MKINVNPVTNRDLLVRYTAGRAKPRDMGEFSPGLDNVSFSEDALSFSKALTQARESIDARTEEEFARVREVGSAVKRGEYSVDSGKIAERIVSGIWL